MPGFETQPKKELGNPQEKNPMSKEDMDKLIIDAKGEEETEESLREQKMEMMQEAQRQIEQEEAELKTEGILSKFPDKMKKSIMIAFAGATLFFASGNLEKAEARRGYNYSDILKDTAEDFIRNIPRNIEEQQREKDRQREMQQREMQMEQDQIRREMEMKNEVFERQRQQALSEYQRDIDRAKSQEEIDIARRKYKLKIQTIDEAQNASYNR